MKTNFKKSLAVAGILASLFATSAFASEEPAATKPTMKDRVAAILQEDKQPDQQGHGRHIRKPIFRHSKEEFKHNDMKKHGMKHMRKGGPVSHLTAEQREELHKERLALMEKMKNMTPEQQKAAREEFRKQAREIMMKNMTPEQKADFLKKEADHKKDMAKLKAMTPEQREAYREQHHKKWLAEETKNMSKEEKKAFLERDEKMQKERAEMRAKWNKMTDAEKAQFRKEHPRMTPMQGRPGGDKHLMRGPGPVIPQK